MKCPFEQMVEDAENDYQIMWDLEQTRYTHGRARGWMIWYTATVGYGVRESDEICGGVVEACALKSRDYLP